MLSKTSQTFSFLDMSDVSHSQQQPVPSTLSVPIHPGYPVLPPISPTHQSVEQESSSSNTNNIDVKDFWIQLREHIHSERLKPSNEHGNQRTSNKVVRIFVSSTFTDFFNEREVLIKKVFSALRDEMGPCGIQIIDCDLRWGVSMIESFQTSSSVIFSLTGSERLNDGTNNTGVPRRTRSMSRRQWSAILHWTP